MEAGGVREEQPRARLGSSKSRPLFRSAPAVLHAPKVLSPRGRVESPLGDFSKLQVELEPEKPFVLRHQFHGREFQKELALTFVS